MRRASTLMLRWIMSSASSTSSERPFSELIADTAINTGVSGVRSSWLRTARN